MRKKIVTLTLAMMLSAAMPATSAYADRKMTCGPSRRPQTSS